jgi:F0F1-type ATP synthase delta subunit
METKTKAFDAVAESRKWREATSRKLNTMSREERLEYLRQVRERYAQEYAARRPKNANASTCS